MVGMLTNRRHCIQLQLTKNVLCVWAAFCINTEAINSSFFSSGKILVYNVFGKK